MPLDIGLESCDGAVVMEWESDMTYRIANISTALGFGRERMTIKRFDHGSDMDKFLNTGDNALHWKRTHLDLPPGVYAFAGGEWHNVRKLDASVRAHV